MDNKQSVFGNLVDGKNAGEIEEKAFLVVDDNVVGVTTSISEVANYIETLDYDSTVIIKVGSEKQCLKEQNDIVCIDAVLESNGGDICLPVMENSCKLIKRTVDQAKLGTIYKKLV